MRKYRQISRVEQKRTVNAIFSSQLSVSDKRIGHKNVSTGGGNLACPSDFGPDPV